MKKCRECKQYAEIVNGRCSKCSCIVATPSGKVVDFADLFNVEPVVPVSYEFVEGDLP